MGFGSYVARRLLLIIPTFFLLTILIFILVHLAPGDPLDVMGGMRPAPGWLKDEIRKNFGLDQPLYTQYIIWLSNALRGNLGYSYFSGQWIGVIISDLAWKTLELTLTSQLISIILAIALGVIAAVKKGSKIDNVLSVFSLFGYAMPVFWLALLFILFFALNLGLFPTSGYATIGQPFSLFDHLRYLILPVSVYVIHGVAYNFRLVRSAMIEVLSKPYIITARSKGLSERAVIYKHAFRNALLPVITALGMEMGFLLSGSVVLESIFAWPGLGRFIWNGALSRDYPAVMGSSFIIIIMVLIANVGTDIAYHIVDPRVEYE